MLQARDIMTRGAITVGPDTPVAEITATLIKHRISAVPVIDNAGNVLGIVSEGDLMRRAELGTEKERSWWLTALVDSAELAHAFVKSHGVKASEIMTSKVITVDEDASLAEVAETLEHNGIKRVPVLRNGRLVGIVSRANLLQALSSHKKTVFELPIKDDREIRERILETLEDEPWAETSMINIVVSEGTVHLWGMVSSDDQRAALRVAAEGVPGVTAVEDHIAIRDSRYGAE